MNSVKNFLMNAEECIVQGSNSEDISMSLAGITYALIAICKEVEQLRIEVATLKTDLKLLASRQ